VGLRARPATDRLKRLTCAVAVSIIVHLRHPVVTHLVALIFGLLYQRRPSRKDRMMSHRGGSHRTGIVACVSALVATLTITGAGATPRAGGAGAGDFGDLKYTTESDVVNFSADARQFRTFARQNHGQIVIGH
jgi:hypothetical protein